MHTDSPVIKKKSPLFNCESGPAGSRPRFRRGIVPTMTTHSGNGSAPGSRVSVWISFFCFAESHSFASQQKFIPGGGRRRVVCGQTDEFAQTDARTRTRSRNFPKHFPANNKQQLFLTSVSRRWIEIRGALSSSHLLSCFRTRSENVTFADFPYFRPHVTSRAGTHSVLLEPFPIWHVQYGLYVIFVCLSSEMFTFMTPFFTQILLSLWKR